MVKSQALQVSIHTAISATSLVALICDNTLNDPKHEKVKQYIIKIHKDVSEFNKKLITLESEYQKLKAKKVTKESLKKAITLSLEVRKLSQNIEKLGFRLTKIGNKSMHADARTSIHMAHAASKSALENIKAVKSTLAKTKN